MYVALSNKKHPCQKSIKTKFMKITFIPENVALKYEKKNYVPDLLPPFFEQFQYNVVQPYKQTCTELLFAPFQNVDFAPFELFFEYQSHNPIRGV